MNRAQGLSIGSIQEAIKEQWKEAPFRFVELILLPVIGLLFGIYYEHLKSKPALAVSFGVGYVVIIAAFLFIELRRRSNQIIIAQQADAANQKVKEAEEQKREAELKAKAVGEEEKKNREREALLREAEMLINASRKVTEIAFKINSQYSKLKVTRHFSSWDTYEKGWAYNMKVEILKSICDILKQDRRRYIGPSDYFKATLFRVVTGELLELDCLYYPPGMSSITRKIKRDSRNLATAFHALDKEAMQIIPNVPEEARKGNQARWVELYQGQSENYGSMISVLITTGEIGASTRQVISVLTIDTNRLDYFSDKKEDAYFLANFLAPFRYQLSFLYLVTSDGSLVKKEQHGTKDNQL